MAFKEWQMDVIKYMSLPYKTMRKDFLVAYLDRVKEESKGYETPLDYLITQEALRKLMDKDIGERFR